MNNFNLVNSMFENFDVIFTVIFVIAIVMFIFTFALMFSPKLRSKMMKKQIRATKYMIEESQDDLESLATTTSNIAIKTRKKVFDNNEDALRDIVTKNANINKDAVEITVRAIKKGLSTDDIYCKYCGEKIDDDSVFCKYCGKNQNK